jgi:hypothetical protein
VASGYPDFAPDLLQVTSGKQHQMVLASASAGPGQIIVTAYEARVTLEGQVVAPGLLGGPASSCTPGRSTEDRSAQKHDRGDRNV